MVNKTILVIKSPPHGSGRAAEGLRIAAAMIAMDVMPQIIFIDDGAYCLLKNQRPESAGLRSFSERLKTLADLAGVYAVSESLAKRNLGNSDLDSAFNVKTVSLNEAAGLIAQTEAVMTF